ncbi:MAG: twin-arginine translocase TatA/TatE family subunit [Aquificaceae bacterium]|nr:twin-arginine translocase TatA/TatE family subunit [Aquificaceae bacterium]MCX8060451.1 twin-arginine translocase TatA/TatE family subunit [Aquificaceae bacterium]MDW8097233.1 twin-arginine translocase TatA/TatE family subunit [Aquificaceae bacterium]
MDFPEILLILAVAFIFLGPERMMEVAVKLGEFLRKVRETWDELRYQLYMESINRKIMEESRQASTPETEGEQAQEVAQEDGTAGPSQDAPDGASEGTKKQAD